MVKVVAAVIEQGGRFLLARRPEGGPYGSLWEFPGGKVEPGETPEEALQRELKEELGIEVEIKEHLLSFPFRSSHLNVDFIVYRAHLKKGHLQPHDHDELQWVKPEKLMKYALAEPDHFIAEKLQNESVHDKRDAPSHQGKEEKR